MKNGQTATASPSKADKERLVEMFEKFGSSLTFSQARQFSAGKVKATDEPLFNKVKEEYLGSKKAAKAAPKPTQKLGAGKETVFALLDERGPDLSYADAFPLLKAKGVQMGAEWYRRLVNEYRDQKGIPRPVSGGVRGGTPAETKPTAPEPSPQTTTGMVLDANNRIAEREEELARNGPVEQHHQAAVPPPVTQPDSAGLTLPVLTPAKQEETPAPATTPIADAIAVAQDLITRVGKADALKMIERL